MITSTCPPVAVSMCHLASNAVFRLPCPIIINTLAMFNSRAMTTRNRAIAPRIPGSPVSTVYVEERIDAVIRGVD